MQTAAELAFQELIAAEEVENPSSLEPSGKLGDFVFSCTLPIHFPNNEGLPESARFRVLIPARFPHAKVEFIPVDQTLRGFAHQDARTGALCLKPTKYPHEPGTRLRAYVESAKEWLTDAAMGTLLEPGQHWELPDFRTAFPQTSKEVLPSEDANTFLVWKNRVGQSGEVQFVAHTHGCGIVPVRFTIGSELVYEPKVNEGFLNRRRTLMGAWLLLPSLIVERHRPARTFYELDVECQIASIDLWRLVHYAVKQEPYRDHHYILVGSPIPTRVGAPENRIHWQPIAIPADVIEPIRGDRKKRHREAPRGEEQFRKRVRSTLREAAIPWGLVTTYPAERAEARGSLAMPMKEARVCILGCGAVGSLIAEHLARGGVRELTLFDSEDLELENLPRHTLSPIEVGLGKAAALAHRLNGIHPSAHVRGYPFSLPLPPKPRYGEMLPWMLLNRADVVIDCTADNSVLHWLSRFGRETGKLVIHLFTNAHARMLTLISSGRHASCSTVAERLFKDIATERAGFTPKEHNPYVEELFPGAGCWHATFPALGSNIAALVAAAVPAIEAIVSRPRLSTGAAVVFRRRDIILNKSFTSFTFSPGPIIEVAWAAEYR